MGDEFLDLPPDQARRKLEHLNIDPEYFLATPVDPDERGLTRARQTLAGLLGLAMPGDDGLYPALDDYFHSLTIGPCSPGNIAKWEENPWIEVIGIADPEWDCDYSSWEANLSQAIPDQPFELTRGLADIGQELPNGLGAERRGESWVVRDADGSYWCGLVENCWSDSPNDESMPALSFPTETEAKSTYIQADRMYRDRVERHRQACVRLGLPTD
jgi:hypothetical protein